MPQKTIFSSLPGLAHKRLKTLTFGMTINFLYKHVLKQYVSVMLLQFLLFQARLKSESYYFFWQHFLFQFHLFFCIAVPTE
jgi:hypothetical protein